MLEFDGHAMDPAIVSAQPMKPVQTAELQQMGCPSGHFYIFYFYFLQFLCFIYTILSIVFYSLDAVVPKLGDRVQGSDVRSIESILYCIL